MDDIIKIGLVKTDGRGRLLVVLKEGGRTYILPGGKPEGDESDVSCLVRECSEEIGVGIVGAPVLLASFRAAAADMDGRGVVVRVYEAETIGEPEPRAEIARIHWIDMDAPDVPIADSIRDGLIPFLKARREAAQ